MALMAALNKTSSEMEDLKSSSGALCVEVAAGSAAIGTVVLGAGTALAGKVGIDQATANANEVVVKSITAGSNIVGKVGIDQTTPGTTNKVTTEGISMTNYDSGALAASGVIKAAAGTLYVIFGYNSSSSDQYFQVFNLAAVPANGVAPTLLPPIKIPAGGAFSIDLGFHGKAFSTGICWSNSSTLATKTIGSADCWVSATYK